MYDYFYSFHNKPFGFDLFSRETEDGTPPTPESQPRITDDGVTRITDSGDIRITD